MAVQREQMGELALLARVHCLEDDLLNTVDLEEEHQEVQEAERVDSGMHFVHLRLIAWPLSSSPGSFSNYVVWPRTVSSSYGTLHVLPLSQWMV